jgi:hypothetical protein
MKYTAEMGSGAMLYISSFINIGSSIQKLKLVTVATLGRWDRGFRSHSRHGCLAYVYVYSDCVVLCR